MFIEVNERHANVRKGRYSGEMDVRLVRRQIQPNLDENHFLIDTQTNRCFAVVRIESYECDNEKTVLSCVEIDVGGAMKDRISQVYALMVEPMTRAGGPTPSYAETSGSSRTSTMDPALAMNLGMDRTASEIADRAHRHRSPDGSVSLVDAMRMMGECRDDEDDY